MEFSHNTRSPISTIKTHAQEKIHTPNHSSYENVSPFVGHMVAMQTLANLKGENKNKTEKLLKPINNFPLRLTANKTY